MRPQQSLVILAMARVVSGLDLAFDYIQCDTTLPIYAEPNAITMSCNDKNTRCTFGQNATFTGKLIYDELETISGNTSLGYVTGNLQLMTLDYELFTLVPIDYCGDWLYDSNYGCPNKGIYHFQFQYELPDASGMKAWFASGWQGISYLKVYSADRVTSSLTAHCKLHFKTFVTDSGEKNWYTLPSAAQATIVVFCVLGSIFLIIMCMAWRTSDDFDPNDPEYGSDYKTMDEDGKTVTSRADEEAAAAAAETFEKAQNLAVKLNYGNK